MYRLYILLLVCLCACKKEAGNSNTSNPVNTTSSSQASSTDTSYIHVYVDSVPVLINTFSFERTGNNIHATGAGNRQKIDLYTSDIYGTSSLNYQYILNVIYGTLSDGVNGWHEMNPVHGTEDIYYNCCAFPLTDSVLDGTLKAIFLLMIPCMLQVIFIFILNKLLLFDFISNC